MDSDRRRMQMLNTDIEVNGNQARVVLEGKLDANTAPELREKLSKLPDEIDNIELDIEKVIYISSAGLRVILQYHNQMNQRGGKLTVCHPSENIMEVLEDTGLSGCLNIQK